MREAKRQIAKAKAAGDTATAKMLQIKLKDFQSMPKEQRIQLWTADAIRAQNTQEINNLRAMLGLADQQIKLDNSVENNVNKTVNLLAGINPTSEGAIAAIAAGEAKREYLLSIGTSNENERYKAYSDALREVVKIGTKHEKQASEEKFSLKKTSPPGQYPKSFLDALPDDVRARAVAAQRAGKSIDLRVLPEPSGNILESIGRGLRLVSPGNIILDEPGAVYRKISKEDWEAAAPATYEETPTVTGEVNKRLKNRKPKKAAQAPSEIPKNYILVKDKETGELFWADPNGPEMKSGKYEAVE